jgi:hypothetical protein
MADKAELYFWLMFTFLPAFLLTTGMLLQSVVEAFKHHGNRVTMRVVFNAALVVGFANAAAYSYAAL